MGFSIHQLICTAKLHGFFQYAKQVACSTGWVLTSVTTHSSSSHKGRFCRRAQKDVLTQQKGTGTSNIRPKPASPPPPKKKQQLSTWWVSQPIRDCFRKLVNFFQLQKSPGFRTIHLPMWTPRLWDFGTDLRLVRFRNSNGNHRPLQYPWNVSHIGCKDISVNKYHNQLIHHVYSILTSFYNSHWISLNHVKIHIE